MKFLSMLFAAMILGLSTYAENEVQCSYTNISSNITSNTTLYANTLYRLTTCVHVTDGHTLTIEAGTRILASSGSSLIIDKGATISAIGAYNNPIIFTSDKTPTHKNYGDWAGVYLLGKATNNQSNSISIENRSCSVTGGGTNDADNSGTMQYVRIEYADYGLTMVSVGSGTTIDHIQASYITNDAYQFFGGTVNVQYLTSLNAKGADFRYEYGIRNQNQYLLAVRVASDAHLAAGSNSVVMANNESGSSYSGTPTTHPVISNSTFIGPLHCSGSADGEFKAGVRIQHNSEAGFYNNVISGWPTGLLIEDDATITNVLTDLSVAVAYNSFANNTLDFDKIGTWTGTCTAANMNNWIKNISTSCGQPLNQFPTYTLGYDATICGTYSSTPPVFVSSSSGLSAPNYDAGELSGMDEADDRGAINGSEDWTLYWTNWNPQAFNPCPQMRMSNPTGIAAIATGNDKLSIAPNPTEGLAYISFDALQAGDITITLTNNMGQIVRTVKQTIGKGEQKVAFNTQGLSTGMYIVNVELAKGNVAHSRLIVK